MDKPNAGVDGAALFFGGGVGAGRGRACSTGTTAFTGQQPHGDAKQAAPAGGITDTTVQSASLRHSATSDTRRATQRPASHTARKLLAGSGTTIAQTTSSHAGALHRTAMHRCCAAFRFAALIA